MLSSFLTKYKSSQPLPPPFMIWTEVEQKLLNEEPLDPYYKDILNKLILAMNEWVHNLKEGWHHLLKKDLPETDGEIKESLERYLETANKLQKPKGGHYEYMRLPVSQEELKFYINVYQAFWHHCCYAALHKELVNISRVATEELNENNLGKIYCYALTKFKEQEVPHLQFDTNDKEKFLQNIDKVISDILVKCNIQHTFVLTETDIMASLNLSHTMMPKYLTILDLKTKIDNTPIFTRYAHVRPAALVQMAQLIEYVLKQFLTATHEKKSHASHQNIIILLKEKLKEIAEVMTVQEQLDLSFGASDIIEVLHLIVDNESTLLLPNKKFFSHEEHYSFKLCEFEEKDMDAPKPIPADQIAPWRRHFIERINETKQDPFPISLSERDKWLKQNHCVRKYNQELKESHLIPTQMLRLVRINNSKMEIQCLEVCAIIAKDIHQTTTPALYDFFIKRHEERNKFLMINTLLNQKTLEYLLRQVQREVNFIYLLSGHEWRLMNGLEGPRKNFSALVSLVKHLGKPFEDEIQAATKLKQSLREPTQKNIIETYIEYLMMKRTNLLGQAQIIAIYWKDNLKSDASDVSLGIKELNDLLSNILKETTQRLSL